MSPQRSLAALFAFGTALIASAFVARCQTFEPTGDGLGAIAFAPDGTLALLLAESTSRDPNSRGDRRLIYERRSSRGVILAQEVVFDYGLTNGSINAVLFFGPDAQPRIFQLAPEGIHRFLRTASGWTIESTEVPPGSLQQMVATQSPDGTTHFAFQDISNPRKVAIVYARRDPNAAFTWERGSKNYSVFPHRPAFEAPDPDLTIHPRNLSIAADRRGRAHIVFTTDGLSRSVAGGTQVRTDLLYATNAAGRWETSTVFSPKPGFGDGGMGASIAAAPNGTIAIAASFLPRAKTGSPGRARLLYFRKIGAKRWSESTVADTSANYTGADGEKGTGLNPMLTFTERSQPVIVFNDHASAHFQRVGAFSFSGQLRLATRKSPKSGRWKIQTVLRKRGSARDSQIYEPVVAATGRTYAAAAVAYQFRGKRYQTVFKLKTGKLAR